MKLGGLERLKMSQVDLLLLNKGRSKLDEVKDPVFLQMYKQNMDKKW